MKKNEQWALYNLRNSSNLAIVNRKSIKIIDERLSEERKYADTIINKLHDNLQAGYIQFFEELAKEAAEKMLEFPDIHLGNTILELVNKNEKKILAYFMDSLFTRSVNLRNETLNQEKENK